MRPQRVRQFINQACHHFSTHHSEVAACFSSLLSTVSTAPLTPECAKYLTAQETNKQRLHNIQPELMSLFTDCQDELHWRTAGFGKLPTSISGKITVAEILGPNGMLPAQDVRFGALKQCANTEYPTHSHAAEELYYTLEGSAQWTIDNQEYDIGPGQFVHHRPYQNHAMKTGNNPLLALWVWTGDIQGDTYSI